MRIHRIITGKTLLDRERNKNVRRIFQVGTKQKKERNDRTIVRIAGDKSPLARKSFE